VPRCDVGRCEPTPDRNMRSAERYFFPVLLTLAALGAASAQAQQSWQVAAEYENLKYQDSGIHNNAWSVIPGLRWSDDHFISRAELLLEANQDTQANNTGFRFHEQKVFMRLRHSGEITEDLGWYVRGGVGYSWNNERNYSYGYIEPALEYSFSPAFDGVMGYRHTNALDHAPGQRLGELRFGPDWNINKHHTLEVRYVIGRGDTPGRTWVLEYVYRH
jgi:hypothetical protein